VAAVLSIGMSGTSYATNWFGDTGQGGGKWLRPLQHWRRQHD